MKTLFLWLLLIIALPLEAMATSGSATLVFAQVSSARTSTPNLRIGGMSQPLARDTGAYSGAIAPVFVRDYTLNYYLTKSTTVPVSRTLYLVIQVDQTTMVYRNGDLTNYFICSPPGCEEGIR